MHPQLINSVFFGHGIGLSAYPFFLFLAAAVFATGTIYAAHRAGWPLKRTAAVVLAIVIAAYLGGRALHGLSYLGRYLDTPARWYAIDGQGYSLPGAILLAVLAGWLVAKRAGIDVWRLGDLAAPWLGLAIVTARIGCFLNGCCFGIRTDSFWGVRFPLLSLAHRQQLVADGGSLFTVIPVHPVQLYELAAALFGALLAWYLVKRSAPNGTAIAAFGLWYATFRLAIQPLRVPGPGFDPLFPWLYPFIYLGAAVFCAAVLIKRWRDISRTAVK